jgi:hypothetical protein
MSKNEQSTSVEDINPEKIGAPPREVWKPDISKLPDAVVDGKFVLKPGQDLVVQYAEPWRETILWRVVMVYDETAPTEVVQIETKDGIEKRVCVKGTTCSPGHVRLFDLQKTHYGATNYMEASKYGIVLKVWTGKPPK